MDLNLRPSRGWAENSVVSGAIRGVRVLDSSQMLSGSFATMGLADLGADVRSTR
jgi:crotonobetainyl-CoA:carnitine CoA-transferase CaiB-like acyl-CoA transferase